MEDLLSGCAHYVGLTIEAAAILVVVIGSIEALAGVLLVMITGHAGTLDRREVWLRYARWLVAGLTFQLAADIVHTAVAPDWDEIGRLAVVAVVRTFLTFFLDRDIEKTRALELAESRGEAHDDDAEA